tara:strand:+ start:38368 stop:39177 length:810 start_codon:yes stop_codon:yes gene_type:complete
LTSELNYLNSLLTIALILGPLMTRKFFLVHSKIYNYSHIMAFMMVAVGFVLNLPELYLAWPVFCLLGLFLYLRENFTDGINLKTLAEGVPLIFSIIGSIWLFSGANDLNLLGYNRAWSYYASLHSHFLGWILIGSLTLIARSRQGWIKNFYLMSAFLFLILFLLIAFGIDGVPYIKRIGAVGILLMTPLLIGLYSFSLLPRKNPSFYLSTVSLIGILFTAYLAAANEFGFLSPRLFLGVPIMVSLHGLINGLVAIPSLFLAIVFDDRIK